MINALAYYTSPHMEYILFIHELNISYFFFLKRLLGTFSKLTQVPTFRMMIVLLLKKRKLNIRPRQILMFSSEFCFNLTYV